VPTTVLAEQHWRTFRERMSDYPIRVDLLNRFRTPSEIRTPSPESPMARWTSSSAPTG
jgi:transcription-repair coupling factor (superfamily II helicase)